MAFVERLFLVSVIPGKPLIISCLSFSICRVEVIEIHAVFGYEGNVMS